jgi:hypothetical protein
MLVANAGTCSLNSLSHSWCSLHFPQSIPTHPVQRPDHAPLGHCLAPAPAVSRRMPVSYWTTGQRCPPTRRRSRCPGVARRVVTPRPSIRTWWTYDHPEILSFLLYAMAPQPLWLAPRRRKSPSAFPHTAPKLGRGNKFHPDNPCPLLKTNLPPCGAFSSVPVTPPEGPRNVDKNLGTLFPVLSTLFIRNTQNPHTLRATLISGRLDGHDGAPPIPQPRESRAFPISRTVPPRAPIYFPPTVPLRAPRRYQTNPVPFPDTRTCPAQRSFIRPRDGPVAAGNWFTTFCSFFS